MGTHHRTNLSLPFPTKWGHHTKSTKQTACVDAYQRLPDLVPGQRNPLVILDWSTNCYHLPDLGLNLPCETFTKPYHREEDITHSGLDYVLYGVIMD